MEANCLQKMLLWCAFSQTKQQTVCFGFKSHWLPFRDSYHNHLWFRLLSCYKPFHWLIKLWQCGKLDFWSVATNICLLYVLYKFHLPWPIFYSPSSTFINHIGEPMSISLLHCCDQRLPIMIISLADNVWINIQSFITFLWHEKYLIPHTTQPHFDELVQERCNSSALAMELCLSRTNPCGVMCNKDLTPLLTHWSNVFLALTICDHLPSPECDM